MVVVLSASMEPGFYRGDILFLYMGRRPLQSGEVRPLNPLQSVDIQLAPHSTHRQNAAQ